MRTIVHPGAVRESRMDLVACNGREIEVTLAADCTLEKAVEQALALLNVDSAWLEIACADVSELDYVIPAESPDESHVAWYSDVKGFGEGQIDQLGMIVGRHNGESFLHGHGLWTPADGAQAMGHILAKQTKLAMPVKAKGIGLVGAQFDRRADSETGFELFHVDKKKNKDISYATAGTDPEVQQYTSAGADAEFAAVRLLPNQDFAFGIETACRTLGWSSARVHGLGSVNGARFEDGKVLDSLPTEFLVTDAYTGKGAEAKGPEIVIVGVDGETILSGRLSCGENAVLVTAELVLQRADC